MLQQGITIRNGLAAGKQSGMGLSWHQHQPRGGQQRLRTFQLDDRALCAAIMSTLLANTRWRCDSSASYWDVMAASMVQWNGM